ncbi:Morphology and auto-aggregation control protein [Thalassovita gelatinovora]|uniref:Morphology and auto-aggregation control protein n=1 Tax=Thalassovita gelatinovora TaxID=53501 RepID=A0A0P1FJS1_THAGE|nr:hydrogen peroxide-inducible genes activator [Thalassovita gelatinovora]QIZ79302.1 LysR family transcriptional regulator [Thalassovita gelatinovora]CUH62534.1 Morphology and auto-aggregation control protein [Thalassovita gelatinovora]SEQ06132.1 transcriptional regulator, LysR family [Thalassovita gelatinovora]
MNITLKQLEYFVALTRHRNFGRAADSVHISQPALSVQIRELETQLGQPLVERKTRDIALTPFGRTILDHAERVLAEMRSLKESARWNDGLSGQLRLGVIPTVAPYILPAALAALRARDISLDVQVQETVTARLIDGLRSGALDVALMALPGSEEGLTEIPLFEDRFVLAGSQSRLDALGPLRENLRPTELGQNPLMLLEDGHCLTDQALEVCGRNRGHSQINMGASSLATLSRLVEAGFGLTLMPELALRSEALATPNLRLARFADPQPARQIGLVHRKTTNEGKWLQELAEILTEAGQEQIACAKDLVRT